VVRASEIRGFWSVRGYRAAQQAGRGRHTARCALLRPARLWYHRGVPSGFPNGAQTSLSGVLQGNVGQDAPRTEVIPMDIFQAIYSSQPLGFDSAILSGILLDARRCNTRDGITGALICRADIYL